MHLPHSSTGSESRRQSAVTVHPFLSQGTHPLECPIHPDTPTGGCFLRRNNLQGLDEFNLFDRHENYIFLQEVPRSTENWTLQKWIGNLQLPEMDWTTERAMHLWFAEAARSCQRCSPTWNVFNNVVRLSCPKMYSAAFR